MGQFVVGEEHRPAGEGMVVWAPAGVSHGVVNRGDRRLVLLVGIAPAPGEHS
jgi:mannose-6-phosphate isomerase-like protein (cupin superfamily)